MKFNAGIGGGDLLERRCRGMGNWERAVGGFILIGDLGSEAIIAHNRPRAMFV